jgi:mRNA interferase MazF
MGVVVHRFEVHLVRLDPTEGRKIRKTRPCLIISPDEMNRHIDTVIVAPMTADLTRPTPPAPRRMLSQIPHPYPTRVPVRFRRKAGQIVLDQLRTVDKPRLVKRLGTIDPPTADRVLETLAELFAP